MPEQTDQAETPAQDGAAGRREPPQAAAGADSKQDQPNDSSTQPASDADPKKAQNSLQDAATQPKPATPTASTTEQGHIPNASPSARDGPAVPASIREHPAAVAIPVGRVNGKFVSLKPNQPEPAPKQIPHVRNIETPNTAPDNDLEKRGGISGLDGIPKGWPVLPSSVSLSQEIAWVQSERLLVVKETPSRGIKVDLSKARVPAPSMSALSWLETSIKSYAKFVEVASKQASSGQDEAEFVRRERMQLAEIDALLAEMHDAEG